MSIPPSHALSAQGLDADAFVYLYTLYLWPTGQVRLVNGESVVWQSNQYDGSSCSLTGVSTSTDTQSARPRFTAANPDGVFSAVIGQGSLEAGRVERLRLLREDMDANRPFFVRQSWRVGRVQSLNRFAVTLELRDLGDNPNFLIPSLTYTPPDFPTVTVR